jgi:hypothetical protein
MVFDAELSVSGSACAWTVCPTWLIDPTLFDLCKLQYTARSLNRSPHKIPHEWLFLMGNIAI